MARLCSVNVAVPCTTHWQGRVVESGIWKEPVEGRVAVRGVNLEGDAQADLRVHGGRDKAVYAYGAEDYEWWSAVLDQTLAPGTFGENLTVDGIDPSSATIGSRWRIGTSLLEVSQPRLPCFKLGMRMGDAGFVDRFEEAQRFGAYLRIVEEGDVGEGDAVEVVHERAAGITVRELGVQSSRRDPQFAARLLGDLDVSDNWKDWARRVLTRDA